MSDIPGTEETFDLGWIEGPIRDLLAVWDETLWVECAGGAEQLQRITNAIETLRERVES